MVKTIFTNFFMLSSPIFFLQIYCCVTAFFAHAGTCAAYDRSAEIVGIVARFLHIFAIRFQPIAVVGTDFLQSANAFFGLEKVTDVVDIAIESARGNLIFAAEFFARNDLAFLQCVVQFENVIGFHFVCLLKIKSRRRRPGKTGFPFPVYTLSIAPKNAFTQEKKVSAKCGFTRKLRLITRSLRLISR